MGPPEAVDREFVYIDFLFCVCFASRAFFFLPSVFFPSPPPPPETPRRPPGRPWRASGTPQGTAKISVF